MLLPPDTKHLLDDMENQPENIPTAREATPQSPESKAAPLTSPPPSYQTLMEIDHIPDVESSNPSPRASPRQVGSSSFASMAKEVYMAARKMHLRPLAEIEPSTDKPMTPVAAPETSSSKPMSPVSPSAASSNKALTQASLTESLLGYMRSSATELSAHKPMTPIAGPEAPSSNPMSPLSLSTVPSGKEITQTSFNEILSLKQMSPVARSEVPESKQKDDSHGHAEESAAPTGSASELLPNKATLSVPESEVLGSKQDDSQKAPAEKVTEEPTATEKPTNEDKKQETINLLDDDDAGNDVFHTPMGKAASEDSGVPLGQFKPSIKSGTPPPPPPPSFVNKSTPNGHNDTIISLLDDDDEDTPSPSRSSSSHESGGNITADVHHALLNLSSRMSSIELKFAKTNRAIADGNARLHESMKTLASAVKNHRSTSERNERLIRDSIDEIKGHIDTLSRAVVLMASTLPPTEGGQIGRSIPDGDTTKSKRGGGGGGSPKAGVGASAAQPLIDVGDASQKEKVTEGTAKADERRQRKATGVPST